MTEEFLSLSGFTRYEEKIKRSIFIGSANVVFSELEAKNFIKAISDEFKNATHNCWAYKVERKIAYSDAGEPSGTAGRPIFGAIEKLKLDNIAIVVTRFFGGIKLGVRGLIDAYSEVALRTFKSGEIVMYVPAYEVNLEMDYSVFDRFIKFVTRLGYDISVKNFEFTNIVKGRIYIPKKTINDFENMIVDLKVYGKVQYDLGGEKYLYEKMEV
jgi:uncharacterized YigZ family protein